MGLPAELFGWKRGPARWWNFSDAVAGFLRADGMHESARVDRTDLCSIFQTALKNTFFPWYYFRTLKRAGKDMVSLGGYPFTGSKGN